MAKEDAKQETREDLAPGQKCYWFPASGYQVANFREETRYNDGRIKTPEVPLRASEHIIVTDDPEKVAFLDGCDAVKNGIGLVCKSLREARNLTALHNAKKTVKTFRTDMIEHETFEIVGDKAVSMGVTQA